MPKYRVFQTIENDVWNLLFTAEEWSQTDREKIAKFGEPEIQVGGVYLEDDEDGNEFTIPDRYIKIKSGMPFKQEFDTHDPQHDPEDHNISNQVLAYRNTIIDRLTSALSDLRANPDTFTGEQVYNL